MEFESTCEAMLARIQDLAPAGAACEADADRLPDGKHVVRARIEHDGEAFTATGIDADSARAIEKAEAQLEIQIKAWRRAQERAREEEAARERREEAA